VFSLNERYRGVVDKHVGDVEVDSERNLAGLEVLDPTVLQQATEVLVERSAVRQKRRAQQHVADQPV